MLHGRYIKHERPNIRAVGTTECPSDTRLTTTSELHAVTETLPKPLLKRSGGGLAALHARYLKHDSRTPAQAKNFRAHLIPDTQPADTRRIVTFTQHKKQVSHASSLKASALNARQPEDACSFRCRSACPPPCAYKLVDE